MLGCGESLRSADLYYSYLQNPWRELPRSGYLTNFWLQRSAIGDQSDISNVGVESIKYKAVYSSFVILP